MDKITLLNHPVDVLCDNVRQNATKEIISSSPQNEKEKTASSSLERCFLFSRFVKPRRRRSEMSERERRNLGEDAYQ